jgi:hypothetical protein
MAYKWNIEVNLYEDQEGNIEFDQNADGTQGVGDIYAFNRVNKFYEALEEDEEAMTEEGRELVKQAKALNEELIGELRRALFEDGEEADGEEEEA